MMCSHMRELMLVAELDELGGVGATSLAAHVRQCDRCRLVARRIAAGTRRFGTELALAEATGSPVPRTRRAWARRAWLTGAIGLAAAASFAIVVTRQRDGWTPSSGAPLEYLPDEDSASPPSFADPITEAAVVEPIPDLMLSPPLEQVSVDVPEGRRAVVMKTRNPSMTVVWLH